MKKFTIKRNNHYSSFWRKLINFEFGFTFKKYMKFEAIFDESCLYDFNDIADEKDINKLYGFSTAYNHHEQSARIGWRCLDNENIEILTYCYDDKKRLKFELLGTVKPNEKFECKITVNETNFLFHFKKDNILKIISTSKKFPSNKFKYKLYFYFGGNLKAPHDMFVKIKDLP